MIIFDDAHRIEIERFLFLFMADLDFLAAEEAIAVLNFSRKTIDHSPLVKGLTESLMRDITISYARPFSENRGIMQKRHRLQMDALVPKEFHELHNELIERRDTIFAHTDLSALPRLISRYVTREGKGQYAVTFKKPKFEDLYEDVPKIMNLLAEIRKEVAKLKEGFGAEEDKRVEAGRKKGLEPAYPVDDEGNQAP
jgi:hypothetical protein